MQMAWMQKERKRSESILSGSQKKGGVRKSRVYLNSVWVFKRKPFLTSQEQSRTFADLFIRVLFYLKESGDTFAGGNPIEQYGDEINDCLL